MALFIWKVVWDYLPTRSLLARRGMRVYLMYVDCPKSMETVCHMLFECPRAAQVWRRASFFLPGPTFGVEDFLRHVRIALRLPSTAGWGLTAVYLAYHIWLDRNVKVFEGRRAFLRSIVERALCQVVEIMEVGELDLSAMSRNIWDSLFATTTPRFVLVSWKPPPSGHLKVNFDGSMSGSADRAGVAFVIRNYGGRLIAAGGFLMRDMFCRLVASFWRATQVP
ncbi:uncharacterized protein LOC120112202 [Phoenix dactylifera]|uniref:Uncharacterized protein LOC120112202 n=1 Tax=Phoenix dactylifera TaxID=42345 RepID=A0A8B9AUD1_PHODC|nr:uncharacterized protein LOC120112202 [Phoenix dactylifera]